MEIKEYCMRDCICDTCVDAYILKDRSPSPDRLSTKVITYDDIFKKDTDIPYGNLFPPEVEMHMKQIQAQREYLKAAQMMNEVMDEMSLQKKHNDKRYDIRERLRRKLAQKRAAQ